MIHYTDRLLHEDTCQKKLGLESLVLCFSRSSLYCIYNEGSYDFFYHLVICLSKERLNVAKKLSVKSVKVKF